MRNRIYGRLNSFAYSETLHVLSSADFLFKINFLEKNPSGIPSLSNSLDPDQARRFSGLIWVQTVCKGYRQTTHVGKELND